MQKQISSMSGITYKYVIKPVLFRIKPDKVHSSLLKSGRLFQLIPPIRGLLGSTWAYANEQYLSQTLHGVTFKNPVGLSAGFDKNLELARLLKSIGFGFMEGGSLTLEPCDGNPRPWFHRLPKSKSLVVYAGLANEGVESILSRLEKYPRNLFDDFPLNISVAKTNSPCAVSENEAISDYVGSLKLIKKSRFGQMLTINISCPNTYGGEPFTTPERLEKLLNKIDELQLKRPIFIKMPSNLPWPEFNKLLEVITRYRVSGVTISNLAKDRSKIELKDPLPDTIRGNLSGKPTWDISNDLIKKTYQKYGNKLTIIGVGGIFSGEDAYTKIKLGASLVELITGMIFEGPQLIGRINYDLVDLLRRDGFNNVSEAIGVDVR